MKKILFSIFAVFCVFSLGLRDPSKRYTLQELDPGSKLYQEAIDTDQLIQNQLISSPSNKRDAVAPNGTYTMELDYNSNDIYNSTGLICSQTLFYFDNGATVNTGINLLTGVQMQKVDGFLPNGKPNQVMIYFTLQTEDKSDMFPKAVTTPINLSNGTEILDTANGMLFYLGFTPNGMGLPLNYNGTMTISSFTFALQKNKNFATAYAYSRIPLNLAVNPNTSLAFDLLIPGPKVALNISRLSISITMSNWQPLLPDTPPSDTDTDISW